MKGIGLGLLQGLFLLAFVGVGGPKAQGQNLALDSAWRILPASASKLDGHALSTNDIDRQLGYPATVPGTVMANLVRAGQYPNLYHGTNLQRVDTLPFRQAWWYVRSFRIDDRGSAHYRLRFEGLNYRANIWLNGHLLAQADSTENPYRIFEFHIDRYLLAGVNRLAVEVIPPKTTDLSIGFVDWNPAAPDNNMGLWRPVRLLRSGPVAIDDLHLQPVLQAKQLSEAHIYAHVQLHNLSQEPQEVEVQLKLADASLSQRLRLAPGQRHRLSFDPKQHPQLTIKNPRLWWPNGMGTAELYTAKAHVRLGTQTSDTVSERFGIRHIEEYINPQGHKGWRINGRELLIKGAGWVDDLLLADSDQKVVDQLDYVRHIGLNTIRLEGFWGNNHTLYQRADENGLLIMIGWSCHWEWEAYCHRPEDNYLAIRQPDEMRLHTQSYIDQVRWLRNHPSVFMWVFGSDKLPLPQLEQMLRQRLSQEDSLRPVLASCKWWDYGTTHYNTSSVSGPTRVKMLGPYSYVAPRYWYQDTLAGGAYGFNTETGPGPQVPPLVSLRQMLPTSSLWPIDTVWNYHCGRHEFGTLDRFLHAFERRYGPSTTVEDFAAMAQVSNYEAMRPMFEAFAANRPRSTGVVQWMLNSAWPEMFWQLYDWYLVPNGAFYGARQACQPLHLRYHYEQQRVYLSNENQLTNKELVAHVSVYDTQSNVLYTRRVPLRTTGEYAQPLEAFAPWPKLPETYLLRLELIGADKQPIGQQWYWLSTQPDEFDYANTSWVGTPPKGFARLQGLRSMPATELRLSELTPADSSGDWQRTIEIENTGKHIAFFVELRAEDEHGQWPTPVFWSDNYISLLPGERRSLQVRIPAHAANGKTIRVRYSYIHQ